MNFCWSLQYLNERVSFSPALNLRILNLMPLKTGKGSHFKFLLYFFAASNVKLTLEPVVRIDWLVDVTDFVEVFKLLLLLRL